VFYGERMMWTGGYVPVGSGSEVSWVLVVSSKRWMPGWVGSRLVLRRMFFVVWQMSVMW